MTKRFDAITAGYVSMDRIIKLRSPLKTGQTSLIANGDNAEVRFGGCPINIAYLLARLGLSTLPIVRVGRDYRESGFFDFLRDGGVSTEALDVVAEDTTSNCYLLEDEDGQHVTVFYPGAQDAKYSRPMSSRFFGEARLAVMTVGATSDNIEFFGKCRAAGVPLVFGMKADFDAFPPGVLGDFLRSSRVIFTNESEREEIERRLGMRTVTELIENGEAEIIVTTMGKRGSIVYETRDGRVVSQEIRVARCANVVDTTGSGDAYMAGFIYGYLKGRDTATCCRLGSTLAAFIIEKMGCCTNAPTEEQLLRRLREEGNT